MKKISLKESADLTVGPVIKKLILFFLPIMAGTLFQQLYNAVDAFVVSKFVGTSALAAVGGTPATVSNFVVGFCVALTGGCSVVISHYYGAKKYSKVTDSVKTSFIFCLILGIFAGGLIIGFSPAILRLLKTNDDIFNDALLYQRIYFIGCVFSLIYNMGASALRAVGNSVFPFISLFVGCVANIILDVLFVVVFKWAVMGVAVATVVSELISCIMIVIKLLCEKKCYRLTFKGSKFDFQILKEMIKIGLPAGLQSSVYSVSNVILQVGVNTLGEAIVASWAMCGKVDGVYWATSNAFGTAVTSFIAQNYGANDTGRIKECIKKCLPIFLAITIFFTSIILLFGRFVISILTDDTEVIDITYILLTYFVPYYIIWSVIEFFSGILRGVGDTVIPFIILAITVCLFRILWVIFVFNNNSTLFILSLCYPISWFMAMVGLFTYYFISGKKKIFPQMLDENLEQSQNQSSSTTL